MKYFVHIYAIVRAKVEVDAESQEAAVLKANDLPMNRIFDKDSSHLPDDVIDVEFADEVQDFLVDEEGDTEYDNTRLWKLDDAGKPVLAEYYQGDKRP